MRILLTDENGIVCDAEIDVAARKAVMLSVDDDVERVRRAWIALNTLCGEIEARVLEIDPCGVVSACRDGVGWVFFDKDAAVMEWPENWPEFITEGWLTQRGVKIAS